MKNFPDTYDEAKLREMLGQYGPILSFFMGSNAIGRYVFVCYGDENDAEVGPKSALKAVEDLNDKVLEGSDKPLYVKEALKKSDRAAQSLAEKLRFKNSKKRCNLFVKNLPHETTEEQLSQHFGQFGQIETVKVNSEDP